MDRHFHFFNLKKAGFLVGALFLGWAAQAQSTNNSPADSTQHQYGMHRRGGHRPDGDSSSRADGFRHEWNGERGHGGIRYTPEQRKQVAAIAKEYHQKSADLFKQDNITLKQYKNGLIALQKEKKEKMAALLTQQQKDELAASHKRMDENRQVMEAAHLERLKLRLDLSDDQVAKIKAGSESLHSQAKAIHENDNLLPQEKREQMKALLAKRNDTYKSVLTPEQYSQFEKMHERGFGHGEHRFGGPGAFEPGHGPEGFGPDGHRGPDGFGPGGPGEGEAI